MAPSDPDWTVGMAEHGSTKTGSILASGSEFQQILAVSSGDIPLGDQPAIMEIEPASEID